MKKTRLLLILPLVSFLAACSVTDYNPFQEDKYIPIGFQTESIVRLLTDDETDVFEDGIPRIDDYVTGLSQTTENRDYDHSYFGDYSSDGANGIDYSLSSTADIKLYENHVRVSMQNMSESVLNDYLDYTTTVVFDQWTYLPTPTTFEVRFSLQVNEDSQVFVFADGAYDDATDYDDLFGFGATSYVESASDAATAIGMNADDEIIILTRTSSFNTLNLSRNGFVRTTNSLVSEIKLALFEPEDSDDPLYFPVQAREYIETRVVSEIYHAAEVIKYLNEPIVIGYNETIIKWSTEVNGDYDLEEIPEITEV